MSPNRTTSLFVEHLDEQFSQTLRGTAIETAFPKTMNRPAELAQSAFVAPVAFSILSQFRNPIFRIRLRESATEAAVSMPEAPLHLDDDLVLGEDDVGGAGKITYVQPESKPKTMKSPPHEHLWLGIR